MIEQQNKGDMRDIRKQIGAAMRAMRKARGQTLMHLAAQSGTDLSYHGYSYSLFFLFHKSRVFRHFKV